MSRAHLGQAYEHVVDETIRASVRDFEDYGLSSELLDSLRLKWQENLSEFGVAQFSWIKEESDDDAPQPLHSTSRIAEPFQNPALAAIQASQTTLVNGSSRLPEYSPSPTEVKQEPLSPPSNPATPTTSFATPQLPPGMTVTPSLKRRISQVSDAETSPSHRHHQVSYQLPLPVVSPMQEYTPSPPPQPKRRPDPNTDELTSDLDDSDDDLIGNGFDDDDDEDMDFMVCTYEKVHRTKSKYKVILTHGVVGIQGREWVFEKASGEYEWV